MVRAEAEAEALEKRRAECAVKLQALGAAPRGSRREMGACLSSPPQAAGQYSAPVYYPPPQTSGPGQQFVLFFPDKVCRVIPRCAVTKPPH